MTEPAGGIVPGPLTLQASAPGSVTSNCDCPGAALGLALLAWLSEPRMAADRVKQVLAGTAG